VRAHGRPSRMRAPLLVSLASALFTVATVASPCDCLHGTAKQERKRAEVVFLGEIVDIQESANKAYPRLVTLRVERYWKAKKRDARTVQVLASEIAGSCPMILYSARNLVYAYREGSDLVTWTCSRTKREEEAAQEMKELGKGFAPR
jgi:hypothetical protein